jgi:hypothetical protein
MALRVVTDTFTVSILSIRVWQDIWARAFGDQPLRVTLEYLIHTELDWLNQDFKTYLEQNGTHVKWVAQEELWRNIISPSPVIHSRLFPILIGGGKG